MNNKCKIIELIFIFLINVPHPPDDTMAYLVPLSMCDRRYSEISAAVRESFPNACILYIEEVQNQYLVDAYESRKRIMIEARGQNVVTEMTLFHGTSEACAHSIVHRGYDCEKNTVSAYGKGTYFATAAGTSIFYAKDNNNKESFMLMNKVLIGVTEEYRSGMQINTVLCDNSVNRKLNPSIVVTPYNDGALPLYLIAFYKHAK